jgi:tetratricopeptide (TPR) repeat protein
VNKRLDMLVQLVASGTADSFGWYALALEYRKLGRIDDALKTFEALSERDPDYLPMYLMAGQMLTEADRLVDAVWWLERGLALARRVGNSQAAGELEQALDLVRD